MAVKPIPDGYRTVDYQLPTTNYFCFTASRLIVTLTSSASRKPP